MTRYRYCIEVERVDFETTDLLQVSNSREEAEATLAAARMMWNDGDAVVVRVGVVDPIILAEYPADEVVAIRLVDLAENAA